MWSCRREGRRWALRRRKTFDENGLHGVVVLHFVVLGPYAAQL